MQHPPHSLQGLTHLQQGLLPLYVALTVSPCACAWPQVSPTRQLLHSRL